MGATFISPFVGRLDDIAMDGMQLISDIVEVYDNYPALMTEAWRPSVADARVGSGEDGADVRTLPPDVLLALFNHPLTDKGPRRSWPITENRPVDPLASHDPRSAQIV